MSGTDKEFKKLLEINSAYVRAIVEFICDCGIEMLNSEPVQKLLHKASFLEHSLLNICHESDTKAENEGPYVVTDKEFKNIREARSICSAATLDFIFNCNNLVVYDDPAVKELLKQIDIAEKLLHGVDIRHYLEVELAAS